MRVEIRYPQFSDEAAYFEAVTRSAEHIGRWNPVEPRALPDMVRRQGEALRTFMIFDTEDGGLVGTCNVSDIVRRRYQNAALGYNSYLPYNGTGRMTEGMRLVVDACFRPQRLGGLGLHRLEISVQPENGPSVAMAKRLGFRLEGYAQRMLYLRDQHGVEDWRDHERYALTAEEWPGAGAGDVS
ncbi:GNAT family N-acetyltransferase [Streptacidiphilus pinicola]|uniref:GNAT family N-acetyltransferase n=1 Tax=Streptacidiphilus pinicola TaxID=2219663 RepID=A0A2X0IAG6_9ACTN|nr:GNAT family protein [Streptacidiphilus pinicola]RAG81507.1 GNAT family N-acetyltransferase [Streptacidiphilus pinicola]